MTPQEEARFEAKAEKHFKSQRELLPGRDFRWNCFRFRTEDESFRKRFDRAFPNAPGSRQWFDRYCNGCGKLPDFCRCKQSHVGFQDKGV